MPAEVRRKFLVIDGHSIIFQWPDLRSLHEHSTHRARVELIRRLTAYQDVSDERVVIVFDGKGPRTTSESKDLAAVQVIFASAGRTADSVIERLVALHGAKDELTVATGDEAERLTVSSLGAWWIGPDGLRERIEHAEREAAASLKALQKKNQRGQLLGDVFSAEGKERHRDDQVK